MMDPDEGPVRGGYGYQSLDFASFNQAMLKYLELPMLSDS